MSIVECIPDFCLPHVKASGKDLYQRIGKEQLRSVVIGVLCGENIRAATEPLTRYRISILNSAILLTLVRASEHYSPEEVLEQAHSDYNQLRGDDPKRSILMWILGLTGKQIQNVLRSNEKALVDFFNSMNRVSENAAKYSLDTIDELEWNIRIGEETATWDWLWAHLFMTAVGAQSLATRGSEKSMYGKLFERLILGSALSVLGFQYSGIQSGKDMTFWLSERGEKRESDATAIVSNGKGIRFDIGFIGPGNTEISLDKVSRFERFAEIAGQPHEMQTIIIVDRIGKNSRIYEMAEAIDGKILQMSSSIWIADLDSSLHEFVDDYERKFEDKSSVEDVRKLVESTLEDNRLEQLLSVTND